MRPRLTRRWIGAVFLGVALHATVSGAADPVGPCPPSETFCAEPVPARPVGVAHDSVSPPDSAVLDVFVRSGCPHCAEAKQWLEELKVTRPALDIRVHAVNSDPDAAARFSAAVAGLPLAGVPTFASGGRVVVGFDPEQTPGAIIALLDGRDPGRTLSLPLIGEVDPSRLGLPVFTIVLGLIDGFNPCAMWVLLFLLSMLLHMKDRARMLAVAGTFVAVSGLVYFAFMAAWLNVFLLVGLTRPVQVVLGLVALAVGTIHVKDFFALREGISLSIPESAKPGIIERIRRILRAEKLPAALAGAVVLAVLVNLLELPGRFVVVRRQTQAVGGRASPRQSITPATPSTAPPTTSATQCWRKVSVLTITAIASVQAVQRQRGWVAAVIAAHMPAFATWSEGNALAGGSWAYSQPSSANVAVPVGTGTRGGQGPAR